MESSTPHGRAQGNIYLMVIKKFHESGYELRSEQIVWQTACVRVEAVESTASGDGKGPQWSSTMGIKCTGKLRLEKYKEQCLRLLSSQKQDGCTQDFWLCRWLTAQISHKALNTSTNHVESIQNATAKNAGKKNTSKSFRLYLTVVVFSEHTYRETQNVLRGRESKSELSCVMTNFLKERTERTISYVVGI